MTVSVTLASKVRTSQLKTIHCIVVIAYTTILIKTQFVPHSGGLGINKMKDIFLLQACIEGLKSSFHFNIFFFYKTLSLSLVIPQ